MCNAASRWKLAGLTMSILALALPAGARAQANCDPPPVGLVGSLREEHPGARRESQMVKRVEGTDTPQISFIDSPTAGCYQPDPAADICWINWYYLSVGADPNYMICMEVTLNNIGKVSHYQGFFQTSMYVPYNMSDRGYRVACGALGAGGDPALGNSYTYTIRAKDSNNLRSANYGTVYCPAFTP